MAGDGLLVRVRPPMGRIDRAQMLALCEAALEHGNGFIDLTNRAALQIRGVGQESHRLLLERLVAIGLADPDPAREARRAIILNPDWTCGDETDCIARSLFARLDELPSLPPKTGIAIDIGPAPCLTLCPADFRLERSAIGTLLLRAEGHDMGIPVSADDAVDALIDITRWFIATGGATSGRMVRHQAQLPAGVRIAPAPSRSLQQICAAAPGRFHGIAFGQIHAEALAELTTRTEAQAIRLTPWRGLILEGATTGAQPAATGPLLRADACPGAPVCPQASVSTRDLATRLAPHIDGTLHVSGCAKGCARPVPADIMLTGRQGLFDLARQARAGSPPDMTGLTPGQILALFGAS